MIPKPRRCTTAGSPFAEDELIVGVYIHLHFMQFLKLYNAPAHDSGSARAARGHIQASSMPAYCLLQLHAQPK